MATIAFRRFGSITPRLAVAIERRIYGLQKVFLIDRLGQEVACVAGTISGHDPLTCHPC
jgi:hypothetical protein